MKTVRSFDVFDTVLTRTFAIPCDLFLAVGEEAQRGGLLRVTPQEFALQRAAAESRARERAPDHEARLAEVYAILANKLRLSSAETEQLIKLELDAEDAALQPVPGMQERLRAAREISGSLLFLSDMYLPGPFVERVLAKHKLFQPGDRVYVSGDVKACKASGELYSRLLEELRVPPDQWVHVGDNQVADDSVPKQLGIVTKPVTETRLNRYEVLARGQEAVAQVWRSRLGAAMRLARLDGSALSGAPRVIWSTGADVAGPLLFGFVYWCLRQAAERGIRRLYFIARDGQILQRIALEISSAWGFDVDCRYLHGSRQAWRVPALTGAGAEELVWATPGDHELSVEHVCARLGLELHQIEDLLLAERFLKAELRQPLPDYRLVALRKVLAREPVQRLVKDAAARARPLLIRYLQQEGLFEGVPFALVDVGWAGNLQRWLSQSLSLAGYAEPSRLAGFYYGLRRGTSVPAGQTMMEYASAAGGTRPAWIMQSSAMLEMFTAADHGSVAGYAARGDKVVPTLAEEENSAVLEWGLRNLQSAILSFTRTFLLSASDSAQPPVGALRAVTHRVFELFYRWPQREEAEVWGTFPFRGQAIENIRGQVVPKWGSGQIIAALLDYRKRPHGWWMEGTLASRPSLPLRLFLRLRGLREHLRGRGVADVDRPAEPSHNAVPGA
jgi:predicted HAD superfamily hydrolase